MQNENTLEGQVGLITHAKRFDRTFLWFGSRTEYHEGEIFRIPLMKGGSPVDFVVDYEVDARKWFSKLFEDIQEALVHDGYERDAYSQRFLHQGDVTVSLYHEGFENQKRYGDTTWKWGGAGLQYHISSIDSADIHKNPLASQTDEILRKQWHFQRDGTSLSDLYSYSEIIKRE